MDRPKIMSRKGLERTTITYRKVKSRRFSCEGASGDWILTSSLLRDAVNEDLDGVAVVLKRTEDLQFSSEKVCCRK